MAGVSHLSEFDCVRAVTLIEEGYSQREVARRLGVHHTTIGRALKRFRETGQHARREGQGRPRCTEAIDDRYIRLQALRNRSITGNEIGNLIRQTRNLTISSRTVRRRLNEGNLRARHPARVPLLTTAHKMDRLRFAQDHVNWTLEDWKRVLFSDEVRVGLNSSDGRVYTWRRPGERYAPCCMTPQVAFRGGSLMFWGGISFDARTELVVVRGRSLTSQRYLYDIIEEQVVPFAPYIGEGFLFMDDNARPHRSQMVDDYLREVGIERMVWPPRSPDLNLIEHVWDHLKKRVRSLNPSPSTLAELETAVLEEWDNIPQDLIVTLFKSMERRLRDVIRARGGNTRY